MGGGLMGERDYTIFIPELIACGFAIAILTVELFLPRVRRELLAYLTAAGALAWGVAALFYIGNTPVSFQEIILSDDFTTFFRLLGASIVLITALTSAHHIGRRVQTASEYYGLLLIGGSAMVYMAAARELITAYISLELLSFCLYVLVGYLKRDRFSAEASLKYILLGAFASAMFLYGMSLLYGVTGTTTYAGIAEGLATRGDDTTIATVVGLMLIVAGVGFKVSAVPFHMWAPDAYEGAPLPITGFLSTASKAAGFALILRLFSGALLGEADEWRWAIALLAAVTMTAGNLIAIQQTNMKRLIAYSSIGQVGYMLVVVAAIGYGDGDTPRNVSSTLLLHLTGYVVSTLALFAAFTAHYNRTGRDSIAGLRGLAETAPFLALVITVSLFSFAGLPFFAGFATKLLLFQASAGNGLLWLVGLGAINSFVSLYYYLMVMRQMYLFEPAEGERRFRVNPLLATVSGALMLGVVLIGVWPTPVFKGAHEATAPLFETAITGEVRLP
ncbi:MAG: NADH-quinone oxidoreductase subunit N [Dehalococcoidia bacterium]